MENASKALMIAGEVLIGILLLALIVFSFSRIRKVEQESDQGQVIDNIVEYNKSFESYNRKDLLGNDIISIINKIEDYNKREGKLRDYKNIELSISITTAIVGPSSKYEFPAKLYSFDSIRKTYNLINEEIEKLLKEKYNGKDIKYFAGLTSNVLESQCQNLKDSSGRTVDYNTINQLVNSYNNLNSVLKEFKKKKFECTKVNYDNLTNRIIEMKFIECG